MAVNKLGATAGLSAAACAVVLNGRLGAENPRFVVVVDVGQGNCNVVFGDDGRPIIYYDLGGGALGNTFTAPTPAPTYCFDVGHSTFILSHWDEDHHIALNTALFAGQLANLRCIAPRQKARRSATATTLVGQIGAVGQLYLWRDENLNALSGNYVAHHTHFDVIRVTHPDMNNSGLALRLREPGGANEHILLTGDATFMRHRPATTNRVTFPHNTNLLCVGLVAGHHGAPVGQQADIPLPLPGGAHLLAYSYGSGNDYGHPSGAGVADYEARGWPDDNRMDTAGAEVAARYAGPRGNVGLRWSNAAPGPGVAAVPVTPVGIDRAAIALMASTAAEVDMCAGGVGGLVSRYEVAAAAAYQAAREAGAMNVAAAMIAPAQGPGQTLAATAAQGAVAGALGSTLGVAVATAGAAAVGSLQTLAARVVDCVQLAAAAGARLLTEAANQAAADLGPGADLPTMSKAAAAAAYQAAGDPGLIRQIGAAVPDEFLNRALVAALAHHLAAVPAAGVFRTILSRTVALGLQARLGNPGVAHSEQPWAAAGTATAQTVGLARDDLALAIAAAVGCSPSVPVDPAAGAPATLIDNENAKIVPRIAAVAALAAPAIVHPTTRAQVAAAAAGAARVALAAAMGAPQVGCHRHPRTCANGPCSLSMHYFRGMFASRITPVAGSGVPGNLGDGGPATAAYLTAPRQVVQDSGLHVHVSDAGAHRVRRIGTDGQIDTLFGTGVAGYAGDANGPIGNARFNTPAAVAYDAGHGQLYVADRAHHRVRRIDLVTRQVTALAGTGAPGFGGDDGPAPLAQLQAPGGLAYDRFAHALFVADTGNHCVRRVDLTTGLITTAVGQGGVAGNGPDGAPAVALLTGPTGLCVSASGGLYLADTGNHRIRSLVDQHVAVVAGTGGAGNGGDGGSALLATFQGPTDVAVDPDETLWVADAGNHRVRQIDPPAGPVPAVATVHAFAGTGAAGNGGDGGPATAATLRRPAGLTLIEDGAGWHLHIADSVANRVRTVDIGAGTIGPLAGTGVAADVDHVVATLGQLDGPVQISAAHDGTAVFLATLHRVRRIDAGGALSSLGAAIVGNVGDAPPSPATLAQIHAPGGMAYDRLAHTLYLADTGNHCVRRIDLATGDVFLVAGQPTVAGAGGDNGPATLAGLNGPTDLAYDQLENVLYICDRGNNRIRAVRLSTGVITNHVPALATPTCVAVDHEGNLYVATTGDNRIRRITPAGVTTVVAGPAGLNNPSGLAADRAGVVYVGSTGSHVIRRIVPGGALETIAGTGAPAWGGDGGPPTAAGLNAPTGVHVDEAGRNVFIADTGNLRIRRISL